MDIAAFPRRFLVPALQAVEACDGPHYTYAAARTILAICIQESKLQSRYQRTVVRYRPGPARGWAQFEAGTVGLVMKHLRSAKIAEYFCSYLGVEFHPTSIWRAMEGNDSLSLGFARLLLFTDRRALPTTEAEGWAQYLFNWNPGVPRPLDWPESWTRATGLMGSETGASV